MCGGVFHMFSSGCFINGYTVNLTATHDMLYIDKSKETQSVSRSRFEHGTLPQKCAWPPHAFIAWLSFCILVVLMPYISLKPNKHLCEWRINVRNATRRRQPFLHLKDCLRILTIVIWLYRENSIISLMTTIHPFPISKWHFLWHFLWHFPS